MYTKLSTLSIYHQEIGKGKDLIFLHGWKQDVSSFWEVARLLKDDFKIYLVDLPGFGRSDPPQGAFTVSDYADVVEEFIKAKNLKNPVVLGHSLGGRVAIKLASKNPSLLGKLILEDAAGIKPKRDLLKIAAYLPAKIVRYLLPSLFGIKSRARKSFYKRIESDYLEAGTLKDTLKNILAEDLTPDLKNITTDTLLIWGEKDPNRESSLASGRKMYRLIKNSRIEVFEGAGHFPHLELPQKFANYVKDFV